MMCGCCCRCTMTLVFELPEARVEAATPIIRQVMAEAALPRGGAIRAARGRYRHRGKLGCGALDHDAGRCFT